MGKDNKTPAFLKKSPLGKVPVLETPQGCLCEAAAIARFVARMRPDTNMYGSTFFEAGQVDQWIDFAKNELDLPVGMWIYPILGFIPTNANNTKQAQDDLKRALAVLNAHLLEHTFLVGEGITLADVVVACSLLNAFKLVFDAAFLAPFPAVVRWFTTCVAQPEFLAVIGPTSLLQSAAPAPAPAKAEKGADKAAAKAEKSTAKAEKGGKEETPKKEGKKEKKEKTPQPEKKAEPTPEEKAAKDRAKLIAKVVKEGGKKGVEIEGAADMGGLEFFCTTIESPDGDADLLQMAMTAMNAPADPDQSEERKGCSGRVGKMIFSAGAKQLAMVAYVPDVTAAKVPIAEWIGAVAKEVKADIIVQPTKADSPDGGHVACAVVKADPDAGKFPLKDKDTAMAAAFAFLRSKDAFPEDNDDDDDEVCFGDDAFDEWN